MTASEIIDALDGGYFQAQLDALGPEEASAGEKRAAIAAYGALSKRHVEELSAGPPFAKLLEHLLLSGTTHLPAMLDALENAPPHTVRYLLTTVVGNIDHPDARAALRLRLESDASPMVRSAAASALGNFADSGDLATLLSLLQTTPPAPIREPVNAEDVSGRWTMLRTLVLLGPQIHDVRCGIMDGLGNARSRQAVSPLLGFLDHSGLLMRDSAIRALGNIGDSRAIEPLRARRDSLVPGDRDIASIDRALAKIETGGRPG